MKTLKEAKQFLHDNFQKGCICPACGQRAELQKRQVYAAPAKSLINLYNLPHGKFHHIHDFIAKGRGDFSKCRVWGLVTEQPGDDASKKRSGMWGITAKGCLFVENQMTIPKYCYTYNQKIQHFNGTEISIIDALKKSPHDYRDLLIGKDKGASETN